MPKPWEYTRWRRYAMQAVMCAILGLAVLLASWLSRSRAMGLEVPLGPARALPNALLALSFRPPQGWDPTIDRSDGIVMARFQEKQKHFGELRTLTLAISRLTSQQSNQNIEQIMSGELNDRQIPSSEQKLDILGASGVLLTFPQEIEEQEHLYRPPVVAAGALLPRGHVAVMIILSGMRTLSPADYDLVRAVARSMQTDTSNAPAIEEPGDDDEQAARDPSSPASQPAIADAQQYRKLVRRLKLAGIAAHLQPPGQVLVQAPSDDPDEAADLLWLSRFEGNWYLGTVKIGEYFRVPANTDLVSLCNHCISAATSQGEIVPPSVARKFRLHRLSPQEFMKLYTSGTINRTPQTQPGEGE